MKTFFRLAVAAVITSVLITNIQSTGAQAPSTAELRITFPTHRLATPDRLYILGNTYTFNSGPNPSLTLNSGSKPFTATATYNPDTDTGSNIDDYYEITIGNITKGSPIGVVPGWLGAAAYSPPPAHNIFRFLGPKPEYKVTFREQVNQGVLDEVGNYLIEKNLISGPHYIGNANCEGQLGGGKVCLDQKITLTAPELQNPITQHLKQVISGLTGSSIRFEGSVAAPGTLQGFSFSNSKAIAVGGNVNATQGGNTTLGNYIVGTKLSWAQVEPQLTAMFAKRTAGTTYESGTFNNSTWHLNATGNDPKVAATSSFSTPPEGKLWKTDGNLTFINGVNFQGRGTIAVNGNVVFNGTGDITCTNGDFGIIASGSITFDPGNNLINCGAFTALGGNIEMKQNFSSSRDWQAIFVAKGDILLPRVQNSTLTIKYNAPFASDPTVLYKELLGIIFSTSS